MTHMCFSVTVAKEMSFHGQATLVSYALLLLSVSVFLCLCLPTDKRDMTSYNMLLKVHVICAIQIYKIPPFYTEKHIIECITVFIILCLPFPLILPGE